jgi:hypothetical protein
VVAKSKSKPLLIGCAVLFLAAVVGAVVLGVVLLKTTPVRDIATGMLANPADTEVVKRSMAWAKNEPAVKKYFGEPVEIYEGRGNDSTHHFMTRGKSRYEYVTQHVEIWGPLAKHGEFSVSASRKEGEAWNGSASVRIPGEIDVSTDVGKLMAGP